MICIYNIRDRQLVFERVFKSGHQIQLATPHGEDLLFLSATEEHFFLYGIPLQYLQESLTSSRLRWKYMLRCPIIRQENGGPVASELIHLSGSGAYEFAATFSNGFIWLFDLSDPAMQVITGIQAHIESGHDLGHFQPSRVNTVASYKSYLMVGDSNGVLQICEKKQLVLIEQVCKCQIASLTWLNSKLEFIVLQSDGRVEVCQVTKKASKHVLLRKQELYRIEEVSQLVIFNQLNLRGSNMLGFHDEFMTILWPQNVMKRTYHQSKKEKQVADLNLKVFSVFPWHQDSLQFIDNPQPRKFTDFLPTAQGIIWTIQFNFYIDSIQGHNWILAYDAVTEKPRYLFDINEESGIPDSFKIVRLDMRPYGSSSSTTQKVRLLLSLEFESQDPTVCSFLYDLETSSLVGNVIMLPGKSGIFVGQLDYLDASIVILAADQKSLIFFPLDQGEGSLDQRMPRGEIALPDHVQNTYWSPFRQGLTLIYQTKNRQLIFSANRIESNQEGDFSLLMEPNSGFALHEQEGVKDIQWTTLGSQPQGLILTNQRICFVDKNLQLVGDYKFKHRQVTKAIWLSSQTALMVSQHHLEYITCEEKPTQGYLLTKEEGDTFVRVLSDRVIFARKHPGEEDVVFMSRPVSMLEPLLMGYLTSTNIDVSLVQRAIISLDTDKVSARLCQKLGEHGLHKSKKYLQQNLKMNMVPDSEMPYEEFLKSMCPERDLVGSLGDRNDFIRKLLHDPSGAVHKQMLTQKAAELIIKGQLQDAFDCAELLHDCQLALKLLEQYPLQKQEFIAAAKSSQDYSTWGFNFKQHLKNACIQQKESRDKDIKKRQLAFDEAPFVIMVGTKQLRSMQVDENLETLMGIRRDEEEERDYKPNVEFNQESESSIDSQQELDEEKYILGYWRCDEALGQVLKDYSGSQRDCHSAAPLTWSTSPLGDGQPIEYEDKWGKENTPSYSICAPPGGLLSCDKLVLSAFTFEFWLKIDLQQTPAEMTLLQVNNMSLVSRLHQNQIDFEINVDGQTQKTSGAHGIKSSVWNHIAMTRNIDANFKFFVNYQEVAQLQDSWATNETDELTILSSQVLPEIFQVTEIRLWKCCLPSNQLKSLSRQPLSVLFDQKRALKVTIKQQQVVIAEEKQVEEVTAQKQVQMPGPAPKKKGLKFASKLDVAKSKPPKQEPIIVEKEIEIPEQLHQQFAFEKQQEITTYESPKNMQKSTPDVFGDLIDLSPSPPKDQETGATVAQATSPAPAMFDFSMPTSTPQVVPIEQAPSAHNNDFFSFAVVPPQSTTASDPFDFSSGVEPAVVELQPSFPIAEEIPPPVDLFDFGINSVEGTKERPDVVKDMSGFFTFRPSGPQPEEEDKAATVVEATPEVVPDIQDVLDVQNKQQVDGHIEGEVSSDSEGHIPCVPSRQTYEGELELVMNPDKKKDRKQGEWFGEQKILYLSKCSTPSQSQGSASIRDDSPQSPTLQDEIDYDKVVEKTRQQHDAGPLIEMVEKPTPQVTVLQVDKQIGVQLPAKIVTVKKVQTFAEAYEEIVDHILKPDLNLAKVTLDEALQSAKDQVLKASANKVEIRQQIRDLILLRFTCSLAYEIAATREKITETKNTFQAHNLATKIASLANLLILLKLKPRMKASFFKFACRANIKIKNYSAVQKIMNFLKKALPLDEPVWTSKDREEFKEAEQITVANQDINFSQYFGADCDECGANLTFGHATPSCLKCGVKVAICYISLKPIVNSKQTLVKCHVCLADISLVQLKQRGDFQCPLCQMVTLKVH